MKTAELVLPAGSLVKLKTAILYGADAVYAGTPDMSLRTQSKFTLEDLKEGIDFVHSMGKKIYLTLNLYIHNEEAEKLPQFVQTLRELQPDGVLVADPGVFYRHGLGRGGLFRKGPASLGRLRLPALDLLFPPGRTSGDRGIRLRGLSSPRGRLGG